MNYDLSLCVPVTDEPRRGDFWLLGDGNTQTWRPGDGGAPAGKWHEKADVLMRPPSPYGDPADYATPEMVAAREHPDAEVCCDPECRLSGGFAHVGDCVPCDCGKAPCGRGVPAMTVLLRAERTMYRSPIGRYGRPWRRGHRA